MLEHKNEGEFDEFSKLLSSKITEFKSNKHYAHFLTTLISSVTSSLSADDLRKISSSLLTEADKKAPEPVKQVEEVKAPVKNVEEEKEAKKPEKEVEDAKATPKSKEVEEVKATPKPKEEKEEAEPEEEEPTTTKKKKSDKKKKDKNPAGPADPFKDFAVDPALTQKKFGAFSNDDFM